MVHINESKHKLGWDFSADDRVLSIHSAVMETSSTREGWQEFIAEILEWLGETAKAPQIEGKFCSLCIRVKEMSQRHEPLSVDQRIEFMQHLRDEHKIEEYAPEV